MWLLARFLWPKYVSNYSCSLKRSRKFQPEDRVFSLSSVTSPTVCTKFHIIFWWNFCRSYRIILWFVLETMLDWCPMVMCTYNLHKLLCELTRRSGVGLHSRHIQPILVDDTWKIIIDLIPCKSKAMLLGSSNRNFFA